MEPLIENADDMMKDVRDNILILNNEVDDWMDDEIDDFLSDFEDPDETESDISTEKDEMGSAEEEEDQEDDNQEDESDDDFMDELDDAASWEQELLEAQVMFTIKEVSDVQCIRYHMNGRRLCVT